MLLIRWQAGLISLLFLGAFALGQQADSAAQSSTPLLTIHSRTVVIDAVVNDNSGKPTRGLTREDFRVFENGVPQKIDFFESHFGAMPGTTPPAVPLPPNTFTNAQQAAPSGAVNIVLIDSLNTATADRIRVRRQLLDLLNHLPNGNPTAVLELGDQLRVVQGFTSDTALLRASVERLLSGASRPLTQAQPGGASQEISSLNSLNSMGTGGADAGAIASLQGFLSHAYDVQQNQQVFTTLEALQDISRYVSPIPARKNLLWVSGSFPLCIPGMTYSSDEDCPYNDLIQKAINALAGARISLYPIDAGLVGAPNAEIGGKAEQPGLSSGSVNLGKEQFRRITTEVMAEATGGEAFHGNDLAREMADAMDNGSRYYTLAYTPKGDKNGTRKIEIRVVSGKYKIFYRRTYFGDNSKLAEETSKPTDPLRPLMMQGMPDFIGVRYRLHMERMVSAAAGSTVAGDNTSLKQPAKRYRVGFFIAPESVDLQAGQGGVQRAQVEVSLIARGEDGHALNWMVREIGLAVRPEQLAEARKSGIPLHLDFDVPAGAVSLSSGVYDSSANRAGTVEVSMASIHDEAPAAIARNISRTTAVPPPARKLVTPDNETTEPVTIQQLGELVEQLHQKSDKDAAQRLAKCKLTERLSTPRLELLDRDLPGDRSRAALLAVADASAFLPLPTVDLANEVAPDVTIQRAILSRAIDFVVNVTTRMPDFLAEETTERFQDTKFGLQPNDPIITSPNVFHQSDSEVATVRYTNGREDLVGPPRMSRRANSGSPPMGLSTWGVFGPMLQTVMHDILQGKIRWSYWEQSPSGPVAVFRYEVPKQQSTYTLRWCCIDGGPGIYRSLQIVPRYHGEIAIQPASGAVRRMVLVADPDSAQPISTAKAFVEYGPVEIGGKTYICPKRSATFLVARSPIEHGVYSEGGENMYHGGDENLNVTSVSDTAFGNYHVFRSEMKIVEH